MQTAEIRSDKTKGPRGRGLLQPISRGSALRLDAHVYALGNALAPKTHDAARQRKQRVIRADPDIVTGAVDGAALADQDVAGQYLLAAELLQSQALAVVNRGRSWYCRLLSCVP